MDLLYGLLIGFPLGLVAGMLIVVAMNARWAKQDEEKELRRALLAWLRKVDK